MQASIWITTAGAIEYLSLALRSLLASTSRDYFLGIINDFPDPEFTHQVNALVAELQQAHPEQPIYVVHHRHATGVTHCWNVALKNSNRGAPVVISNDDVIFPKDDPVGRLIALQ